MKAWSIAAGLLLALPPVMAAAQPASPASRPSDNKDSLAAPPDSWVTFRLYIENDAKALKPDHSTDRYYTDGLLITFDHQPQWARDLAACIPFSAEFNKVGVGYEAGQLMFTPGVYTKYPPPEPHDRPYAGFLFGGTYLDRANDVTLDHFQLDLGLVGRDSLAEATQIWWHRLIGVDKPVGWHHQMPDEAEIQATFRKKWRFTLGPDKPGPFTPVFQVLPQVALAAGTVQRFAEAGTVFRFGFNLPDDFGPGRIGDPVSTTATSQTYGWDAYLFARATARVVEHNLFLQGDTFRSSEVTVSPRRWVGEAQLGGNLGYHWGSFGIDLTYSQTFQTREFTTQHGTHAWGAVVLAFTWTF